MFSAEGMSYLFSVVDLPEDGLPTSPMRGSRGMTREGEGF